MLSTHMQIHLLKVALARGIYMKEGRRGGGGVGGRFVINLKRECY